MSLKGPYDPDNIFARILRSDIPATTVWQDDHVLAFMDVFPQSEGHVLVISKTSTARNILEIEPEVLTRVMELVRRVARGVDKALKPEGITISQFNGDAGGQTIFHLHFHVVPRWADRPLKGHGHAPMATPEVLKPLAERIRGAMD